MQPEVFTAICAAISEGSSVAEACSLNTKPKSEFFKHLALNPADADQYVRARNIRSDARFESVDEIKDELRSGSLDPNAARVLIDAIKWQCGKEAPGKYGDRQQIDQRLVDSEGKDRTVEVIFRRAPAPKAE